jgi:CopG family nickel-responsive transcriptional regulator
VFLVASGVARFSVSVDPDLLDEFDETVNRMGYTRSSAIQMAMRGFLTDHKWTVEKDAIITGALTMIYEHDVGGITDTLTHIQHHHIDLISSTTHVHLDEHNCLEIIAVKGAVDEIQRLAKKLMTTRGVKQLKTATLMI